MSARAVGGPSRAPAVDAPLAERVEVELVAAVIEAFRERGGALDSLGASVARTSRALLAGERSSVTPSFVDRLVVALGEPELYSHLVHLDRRGRAGYTWPNPHPLRKLSTDQVKAAHVLHTAGGLSVRELGRRLYERYGYTSPKSCATALSAAFHRHGLRARPRLEAVRLSNDARGYVAGRTKNERRRQLRAELRATDPAFRAAELDRLDRLHARG